MKKYLFFIVLALALTVGCENNNIFSWSHPEGGDMSTEALLADGQKAEYDENYEEAIKYYDKILDKDHDNSEALYGKASAELKNAGLDLADLASKVISKDTQGTQDLLETLDFKKLLAGSEAAKDALAKIAGGEGDGTISSDDADVNLNLAVTRVIYSASYLIDKYDIKVKDDFSLENAPDNIDSADEDKIIGEINKAVDNLKVTDMDTVDIEKGFNDLRENIKKINET